jgi:hypothetical protein
MDESLLDPVLDELFPALEALDTQCGAILQFLKDKELATDKDLEPYLKTAGDGSDVRWRVARLRIKTLLASAMKSVEDEIEQKIRDKATQSESEAVSEPAEKAEDVKPQKDAPRESAVDEQTDSSPDKPEDKAA